jgi:hypothetical protein
LHWLHDMRGHLQTGSDTARTEPVKINPLI